MAMRISLGKFWVAFRVPRSAFREVNGRHQRD